MQDEGRICYNTGMVKSLVTFFIVCAFVFAPMLFPVSAHLVGQPPYLKINGQYTNLYPVPVTSLDTFNLPQDAAPEVYLINHPLSFVMEMDRLPAPPDVVNKTKFTWDFGDGSKGEGLTQNHTYTKPGSYFQIIYADDGSTPTPQLLSSVLINVLPNANYKLPTATIQVNNTQSKDPLTDVLRFPLTTSLQFKAVATTDPSAKVVSYFWDFGDQKSSEKQNDTHSYESGTNQVFPLLRIKDSNGFIADSYVELENGSESENKPQDKVSQPAPKKPNSQTSFIPIIIAVLTIGGVSYFLVKRKK